MNAPMTPTIRSPIRPNPPPSTILPGSQPATIPTSTIVIRLSFDRYMAVLRSENGRTLLTCAEATSADRFGNYSHHMLCYQTFAPLKRKVARGGFWVFPICVAVETPRRNGPSHIAAARMAQMPCIRASKFTFVYRSTSHPPLPTVSTCAFAGGDDNRLVLARDPMACSEPKAAPDCL